MHYIHYVQLACSICTYLDRCVQVCTYITVYTHTRSIISVTCSHTRKVGMHACIYISTSCVFSPTIERNRGAEANATGDQIRN